MFVHAVLGDQIYLAQDTEGIVFGVDYHPFYPAEMLHYVPICDDFGPLNLAAIVDFIKALDKEIAEYPTSRIVICVNQGRHMLTNAVFAILKLNWQ